MGVPRRFANRRAAGRALAHALVGYRGRDDVIVLGLPRGGVPVAYEVARALRAPLDVFLVRKLGMPDHEEYALGAIASGGVRVLNREALRGLRGAHDVIERVTEKERVELARREHAFRGDRPYPDLHGRCVIIVDDGLATGSTMRAALVALRAREPGRLIVAVPVAARATRDALAHDADEVVCVCAPEDLGSVGAFYEDFAQTTDDEVRALLTPI